MRIEHVALWTKDLEAMKSFYCNVFNGIAGAMYHNPQKKFWSYFITFGSGARLELMYRPEIVSRLSQEELFGFAHIAFSVGSRDTVDRITQQLKEHGYVVKSEPRVTGDGYYESCILDPEGNIVEITE